MCAVQAFRGSESYIIATLHLLEASNIRSSIAEMGGGEGEVPDGNRHCISLFGGCADSEQTVVLILCNTELPQLNT